MGPGDSDQTEEPPVELHGAEEDREEVAEETGSVGLAGRAAVGLIRGYQKISRHTPPMCRFQPTCSEYTRRAILKYGFVKGSAMGAWRICRCHPFSEGGYDPVP